MTNECVVNNDDDVDAQTVLKSIHTAAVNCLLSLLCTYFYRLN